MVTPSFVTSLAAVAPQCGCTLKSQLRLVAPEELGYSQPIVDQKPCRHRKRSVTQSCVLCTDCTLYSHEKVSWSTPSGRGNARTDAGRAHRLSTRREGPTVEGHVVRGHLYCCLGPSPGDPDGTGLGCCLGARILQSPQVLALGAGRRCPFCLPQCPPLSQHKGNPAWQARRLACAFGLATSKAG